MSCRLGGLRDLVNSKSPLLYARAASRNAGPYTESVDNSRITSLDRSYRRDVDYVVRKIDYVVRKRHDGSLIRVAKRRLPRRRDG